MSSDAEIFASTVPNSQIIVEAVSTEIVVSGVPGASGPRGIQGVQGVPGTPGLSAYDIWLTQGNTGSPEEFFAHISGYIGGQEVDVSIPNPGDVLEYTGSVWTNQAKSQLTDGGNF